MQSLVDEVRPLTRRQRHAVRRYTNPRGYHPSTEHTLDDAAVTDSLITPHVQAALADMAPRLAWEAAPCLFPAEAEEPVDLTAEWGLALEATDTVNDAELSSLDAFAVFSDQMAHALALAWEDDFIGLFASLKLNLRRLAKRLARRVRMARKKRRGW